MNRKSFGLAVLAALIVLGATAFFTYRMGLSRGQAEPGQALRSLPKEVTATVQVVPIREAAIHRTAEAYGEVVPPPGGVETVSLPFDCQIVSLAVQEGQSASRGALLMTVTGSPDAKLALVQARAQARSDQESYRQVDERHRLKLADDAALAQAKGAFEASEARLKSLESRGLTGVHSVTSPLDGTVLRLPFAKGAIVPAGASLAEVAGLDHPEVHLGVQPSDAPALRAGDPVTLELVGSPGAAPIQGTLASVSPAINASTRLIDAYVILPHGSSPPLGAYVRGTFALASATGLVVPYAAVLPEGQEEVLYTVRNDRAVRHAVKLAFETDKEALVSAPGLATGEPVVVSGNYELKDGMAVKVEPHP